MTNAMAVIAKGSFMFKIKFQITFALLLLLVDVVQAYPAEQPSIEIRCQATMIPTLHNVNYRFVGRRDNRLAKTYSGKVTVSSASDSAILFVKEFQSELQIYLDAMSKTEVQENFIPGQIEIERLYHLPGGDHSQSRFFITDIVVFDQYKDTRHSKAYYLYQIDGERRFFEANCSIKQFRTILSPLPVVEFNDQIDETSFDQTDL